MLPYKVPQFKVNVPALNYTQIRQCLVIAAVTLIANQVFVCAKDLQI
jgi:hypothetical protein